MNHLLTTAAILVLLYVNAGTVLFLLTLRYFQPESRTLRFLFALWASFALFWFWPTATTVYAKARNAWRDRHATSGIWGSR